MTPQEMRVLMLVLLTIQSSKSSPLFVTDDAPPNQIIGNVLTPGYLESKYSGQLGSVSYTLLRNHIAPASYFKVSRTTGKLSTRKTIDRDVLCRDRFSNDCRLILKVALLIDGSSEPTLIEVNVDIIDRNDHLPQFPASQQTIRIKESSALNSLYRLNLAHDRDSPKYSIQTYMFEPSLPPQFFLKQDRKMRDSQLVISAIYLELKETLDRERVDHYLFTLKAIDGGSPRQTGSTTIRVDVLDDNDNGPVFSNTTYRTTVRESLWIKAPLLKLLATDQDIGTNARTKYSFASTVDKIVRETFNLDETTGKLYMRKQLDYESTPQYLFEVIASDVNGHPKTSTASVIIDVIDLNDETPAVFIDYINIDPQTLNKLDYAEVEENWSSPKFIAHILVTDKDTGDNGHVNCRLDDNISEFVIKQRKRIDHEVEYAIYSDKSLDHELQSEIHLSVWCSDKGLPPKTTKVVLRIRIKDVNDHAPKLTLIGRPEIRENRPALTHVLKVNATDPDSGVNGRVTFSMTSTQPEANSIFRIDSRTGDISTLVELDRERLDPPIDTYPIIVTAHDDGSPKRSSTLSFDISIIDENDNPPTFKHNPMYFSIQENRPGGEQIGEIIINDRDSTSAVSLRMASRGGVPFIIAKYQDKFYLNTTRTLDRETKDSYKFFIIATDYAHKKSHTATGTIFVKVEDENDNSPTIIFPQTSNKTFYLSYKESKYYELLTVNANDRDMKEGGGHYYFELKTNVNFLDIDPSSGTIRVHREMTEADMGRHMVTVIVRDSGQQPRETTTQLIIIVDDSKAHPSNEYEGKFIDEKGSDWSNDMVLIVVLVMVLLLLLGTLTLFVYVRHWRQPGELLPNFFGLCTGRSDGGRSGQKDGGGDHLGVASSLRHEKDDECTLPLGGTLSRTLCQADGRSTQVFLTKGRELSSMDSYRTMDYDSVDMSTDKRIKARVYHELNLDSQNPNDPRHMDHTRAYEFLLPGDRVRGQTLGGPCRQESLQSASSGDKSYQTLGPYMTKVQEGPNSPGRKNSCGWMAPQTPKLSGSERHHELGSIPRYNSESNLASGVGVKGKTTTGPKGDRYENFVLTDQYKKHQRSMYMYTKSFPHTQASYV